MLHEVVPWPAVLLCFQKRTEAMVHSLTSVTISSVAQVNGWDNAAKSLWLRVRLVGRAQSAYKRLSKADRVDYSKAIPLLKNSLNLHLSVPCMRPSFILDESDQPRTRQRLEKISGCYQTKLFLTWKWQLESV